VADVGIGGLGINPGGEGDMGFHSGGRRPGEVEEARRANSLSA
jgi:hypothetical protein